MIKKLTILVLVHPDLMPPNSVCNIKIFKKKYIPWKTEFDVISALRELGHEVLILGVLNTLSDLDKILTSTKVDFVFNLVEEFKGKVELDYKITEFLEKYKVNFSGCSSNSLIIGRDKSKSKIEVLKTGIKTPKHYVFKKNNRIEFSKYSIRFPLIVKCLKEEASYGITKKSIVHSLSKLKERIRYVHSELGVDCIAEEFIEGQEIYVSAFKKEGNKYEVLPPRKLFFPQSNRPDKEIYTSAAKWSYAYAKKYKIHTRHFRASELVIKRLEKSMLTICSCLKVDGQARADFRVTPEGEIYFIELNPNPNLANDDDFALSAKRKFKSYEEVINQVIQCGFQRGLTKKAA